MDKTIQKEYTVPVAKKIVAAAMMFLLLWITSINFLYMSKDASTALIACIDADGDEDPAGDCNTNPAGPDEKSPDATVTISEEFLHAYHNPVDPDWINWLYEHKVHEAEKLCIYHPESFSPPPEA